MYGIVDDYSIQCVEEYYDARRDISQVLVADNGSFTNKVHLNLYHISDEENSSQKTFKIFTESGGDTVKAKIDEKLEGDLGF